MATTSMDLSSNIMDLPCEVFADILTRLPLKHVHQLQTVSKLWLTNISTPHFKILYNMKSMTRPRALVVQESDQTYSASGLGPTSRIITISTMDLVSDNIKIQRDHLSFKIVRREYSFRVSSNLIIFQHKVCNLMTREIINLPNNSSYPSFCFDVAYIPSTNTYKIVHLFRCNKIVGTRGVLEIGFESIILRDGGPIPTSWQSVARKEYFSYLIDATCVDGVMYWLVRMMEGTHIISMESENEEFLTISCPKGDDHTLFGQGQLADLNGKLCLAYYSKELSRMSLFLLKDHTTNQTWVKEYDINLSGMGDWVRIVGYVPLEGNNGDILINGKMPFRYNIKEKRGRKLQKSNVNYTCLYYDRCFTLERTRLPLPAVERLRVRDLPSKTTSKCEIL
ncbi:putative F-box protein At4g38870 [Solanum verrucosum]|uniref:putative F-box protein At4g38870 n=1 Tax=Solanum verrucosum TaxID=315347 RepID=UPI001B84C636|nr:putative F-box protein At4g38870 [Solanum verrucosum]